MKTSAHGNTAKAAGRRGSGRGQSAVRARKHQRSAAHFDAYADADPSCDMSDPFLSDPIFGVGAAAWTDPETGLPPEAAILHVEEN